MRILTGIQPSGRLHLGNYLGAMRQCVELQKKADDCFYFIADYHSLTTAPDPTALNANIRSILAEYLAAGMDPEKCMVYVPSDVPETCEFYTLLNMHAYLGELEKTVAFKDKARKNPNNVNAGLLTYPVLMAADILQHKANFEQRTGVPVQVLDLVTHRTDVAGVLVKGFHTQFLSPHRQGAGDGEKEGKENFFHHQILKLSSVKISSSDTSMGCHVRTLIWGASGFSKFHTRKRMPSSLYVDEFQC